MKNKVLIKKRVTILAILIFSLIFLSRNAFTKEGRNLKPKFSIKLTRAWGYVGIGDVNRHLESFNNNIAFVMRRRFAPELIDGEITKLNNFGYNWELEAELRIDISPEVAVTLSSLGFISRKNESSLTHIIRGSAGDQISTFTFKPEVKAWVPLRLGICYTVISGSRININFNGGIDFYWAKTSEYKKIDEILPSGNSDWGSFHWRAYQSSLGFYCGIGVELSLTKKLTLVVEAQGRYARMRNLKGTWKSMNEFFTRKHKGTLYYFNMWDCLIGARYDDLELWEEIPFASVKGIIYPRKAILDLSGYTLRAGIKIKIF